MIEFLSLVTQLSKDDFDDVRIENSEYIPRFSTIKSDGSTLKSAYMTGAKSMLRCRIPILIIILNAVSFIALN